jgi:hypothetical protein
LGLIAVNAEDKRDGNKSCREHHGKHRCQLHFFQIDIHLYSLLIPSTPNNKYGTLFALKEDG